MHILFLDKNSFLKDDIVECFREYGSKVDIIDIPAKNALLEKFSYLLETLLQTEPYDFVFTFNYFPYISDVCYKCNIKYLSYIYDSPFINAYDKTISNPCNYVFIFDRDMVSSLKKLGMENVYYMPLCANVSRLNTIIPNKNDIDKYSCDASFVGSLYNDSHNFYDLVAPKLSKITKERLDIILELQAETLCDNLIEDMIDNSVIAEIEKVFPYKLSDDSFGSLSYVYNNYIFCRKATALTRYTFVSMIQNVCSFKLFTNNDSIIPPGIINSGPVDYHLVMPKIFKLSHVNINSTLFSIKTGIPLRAFDIMGSHGMLLTDYREDYEDLFSINKDYVVYTSIPDMLDKVLYYSEHESERNRIKDSAYEKVASNHTFKNRVLDMIKICNLS